MNEVYKLIQGFDNYEISTFGNVRNKTTGRILKESLTGIGYYKVSLCLNGNKCNSKIHRLVAMAFIDNPDDKPFVDHIDNDKLNNHISNLRWCSNSENQRNSTLSKSNTSGIKGVVFDKSKNKWRAQICVDGIYITIGYFSNLEDARDARVQKANEIFGAFTNACEKI